MRILHCFLILAFAILPKNVCCDSSNPLPNAVLSYFSSLPKPEASPFEVPATNTKLDEVVYPQAPIPSNTTKKVTSYVLAVQWTPGVCNGKKKYSLVLIKRIGQMNLQFTVCIYPQYSEDDIPVKSNDTFTIRKISKLRTRLEKNWRSLIKGFGKANPDEVLWEGQWDKHGKESEMELLDYFKNTLDLFDKVVAKSNPKGILKALIAQEIIPKNSKKTTYELKKINDALKTIYGVKCSISCVKNEKDSSLEQIQEIRFTFTPGPDFQMRDTVKSKTSDSCTGTYVWFPLS